MPQLAPMPWITLLVLIFFFKSMVFTTLWSLRAPTLTLQSAKHTSVYSTPWQWN